MDNKITFKKFSGHLKTVLTHKWWVFYYSCKLGIPFRGLVHDMSKFSPVEFWESVRYYTGIKSPIVSCKEDKGYSLAWQHHKGRNRHHYEYWVDRLDDGGVALPMPWKDVLELIADYLGAARAYQKEKFDIRTEYDWFQKKLENDHPKIHPKTASIVGSILLTIRLYPEIFTYFRYRKILKSFKDIYEYKLDDDGIIIKS